MLNQISNLIQARVVSPEKPVLRVLDSQTMPNSCYLKLTVSTSEAQHPIVFYLSPDRRFLSNNLFDLDATTADAIQNASRIADRLLSDASPRLGSSPHVLVEFGDFQCPYCATLAKWYAAMPQELRSRYSLVFKQLPLSQHVWALPAAQLTACVHKVSPAEFWPAYEFLYENQNTISGTTLEPQVLGALKKQRPGDTDRIATCFENHGAAQSVTNDIALAKELQVHSTPTLFLDGYRVAPIRSQDALYHLLSTADKSTSAAVEP